MQSEIYLAVDVSAETASFRIPEYHNYHRTLVLPPVTTLIGMVGAARGLSPGDAQAFFDVNRFDFGISGSSQGMFKDLWKTKSTKKTTDSTIIMREYMFKNRYTFVIGGAEELISSLAGNFSSLHYPLTAGNSDSLMKVDRVWTLSPECLAEADTFEHCLLMGNHVKSLKLSLAGMLPNQTYHFSRRTAPICVNLPYGFNYAENGTRSIRCRRDMTFIANRVALTDGGKLKALILEDGRSIPVFAYEPDPGQAQ